MECSQHLGHMTKMAATPVYGKTLKNLLLQNLTIYDPLTWHVASKISPSLLDDPGLTLTYFTVKSNSVP